MDRPNPPPEVPDGIYKIISTYFECILTLDQDKDDVITQINIDDVIKNHIEISTLRYQSYVLRYLKVGHITCTNILNTNVQAGVRFFRHKDVVSEDIDIYQDQNIVHLMGIRYQPYHDLENKYFNIFKYHDYSFDKIWDPTFVTQIYCEPRYPCILQTYLAPARHIDRCLSMIRITFTLYISVKYYVESIQSINNLFL